MKKISFYILIILLLLFGTSCQKWKDITKGEDLTKGTRLRVFITRDGQPLPFNETHEVQVCLWLEPVSNPDLSLKTPYAEKSLKTSGFEDDPNNPEKPYKTFAEFGELNAQTTYYVNLHIDTDGDNKYDTYTNYDKVKLKLDDWKEIEMNYYLD